jgi:hypothetical protein
MMARMKRYLSMCFIIIIFFLSGCTTCHEVKIDSVSNGKWVADLRHRVCGSYSGYSVALYNSNDLPADSGDGEKEQFQAISKTENYDVNNVPINIQWGSGNSLIIFHETRKSIDDAKSNLMVIKAKKSYQGVRIEYIPEPVLWDK